MTRLNSHWIPEIVQSHDALRTTMRAIEVELDRLIVTPSAPGERSLPELVHALRLLVSEHFEFEERSGFLTEITDNPDDSSPSADDLIGQHRMLEARAEKVTTELDRGFAPGTGIDPAHDRELRRLLKDLKLHESFERKALLRKP